MRFIDECQYTNSKKNISWIYITKKEKGLFSDIENLISRSTALLFSRHGVSTEYWIQSYECFKAKNNLQTKDLACKCCKLFWRRFRGLSPKKTVLLSDYNKKSKVVEDLKKETYDLNVEIENHSKEANKRFNTLRKKVSYWRLQCKNLKNTVSQWRKVEHVRKGFIDVSEDESEIWYKFYVFIDEIISREHAGDPEKISLHKELVRSETFQLGKFNKSGNKRGIRTTKLSSRILNYALGLAHNLGKTNYEKETALRSLPSWSTLTK